MFDPRGEQDACQNDSLQQCRTSFLSGTRRASPRCASRSATVSRECDTGGGAERNVSPLRPCRSSRRCSAVRCSPASVAAREMLPGSAGAVRAGSDLEVDDRLALRDVEFAESPGWSARRGSGGRSAGMTCSTPTGAPRARARCAVRARCPATGSARGTSGRRSTRRIGGRGAQRARRRSWPAARCRPSVREGVGRRCERH